jgi:hypothetical protein
MIYEHRFDYRLFKGVVGTLGAAARRSALQVTAFGSCLPAAAGPLRGPDQLRERRDRFGYSYVTVHEPYMADLAPAIAKLR